jgi:DNA mismatch endonuclease, patch repair protein
MTDVFSKLKRSEIMRSVVSTGTSAEKKCEKILRSAGIRFRKHPKRLAGRPDFVLVDTKVALFVHGCFWHSHENCKHSSLPNSNVEYWERKIATNRRRDRKVRRLLRGEGWHTAVLWECKLRNVELIARRLLKLSRLPNMRKKLG